MKLLTQSAASQYAADSTDYREIIEEIRGDNPPMPLRRFVEVIRSERSIAYWGKYISGETDWLSAIERNHLRAYVGLPPLPVAPIDIAAEYIDPDAAIWQFGETGGTGVIVFDRYEYPHAPATLETALCNQVTKPVAPRRQPTYPDLWAMPTKLLALAISEREDYG